MISDLHIAAHNCYHTDTGTDTDTHTYIPHRAGKLALYYYAGDSECELTFRDLHVEAIVHALPPPVEATVRSDGVARPTPTLTLTLTLTSTPCCCCRATMFGTCV